MTTTAQDRINAQIRAEAYQLLHDLAVNPIVVVEKSEYIG